MHIGDEVFVKIVVQQGLVDQLIAEATLDAFKKGALGDSSGRVWDVFVEKQLLSEEQSLSLRQGWEGGEFPPISGYRLTSVVFSDEVFNLYTAYKDGREYSIKILTQKASSDLEYLSRFKQECEASLTIDHPNVLKAYEAGEFYGWHFLITEPLRGSSLREILSHGPLEVAKALDIVRQIAFALQAASQHKIIHRDIRPENIFVWGNGVAKLANFGLVKNLSTSQGSLSITMAGSILGNPYYVSPEQAMGDSNTDLDVRSDIYSLGITLYEVLTGKLPFTGSSDIEIISQHLQEEPPRPSVFRKELAGEVESIVLRMMAKSPQDRYQAPSELIEDIQRVIGTVSGQSSSGADLGSRAPAGQRAEGTQELIYFIVGKELRCGSSVPEGARKVEDMFDYFLRVSEHLLKVLSGLVHEVTLFASCLQQNQLILAYLRKEGRGGGSYIRNLVQNYRQLYALTVHPTIKNFVSQKLLIALQGKLRIYFQHLQSYLENVLGRDMAQLSTVSLEEAKPILQKLGLLPAAAPSAAATQANSSTESSSELFDSLMGDGGAGARPAPQRVGGVGAGGKGSSLEKRKTEPRSGAVGGRGKDDVAEQLSFLDSMLRSEKEKLESGSASAPASSVSSAGSSAPGSGSGGGEEDPLGFLGGEPVAPAGTSTGSSASARASGASVKGGAAAGASDSGDSQGGSWLLGGGSDSSEEEEGANWLMGDDNLQIDFGAAEGGEQVVSLWGNVEEEAPSKPVIKVETYDPRRDPAGSSFIDVKYDVFFKNTPSKEEPFVDVKAKRGQVERFQEIFVRVRSHSRASHSADGRFVIRISKTHKESDGYMTWFDSKSNRQVIYMIDPKSCKGSPPDKILEAHPFETSEREINRIIQTAVKNYVLEQQKRGS